MKAKKTARRIPAATRSRKNDLELPEWILDHGGSPNAAGPTDKRFSQRPPFLEIAQRHGLTQMAELLRRHGATGATVEPQGIEAFVAAAMRGDRPAAEALLVQHPDYRISHQAMFVAAKRDRVEVVELLLELGISPDVQNETMERPLHVAAWSNSLRVARLLIERGAAIDPVESSYGNTPLGSATWSQHREMIDLLSPHSNDVWELINNGKVERLREVLARTPERAKAAWERETLLMWLPDDDARAMEIAQLLLSLGADPSVTNGEGQTAADRAERHGMFAVAEVLRSHVDPQLTQRAPHPP